MLACRYFQDVKFSLRLPASMYRYILGQRYGISSTVVAILPRTLHEKGDLRQGMGAAANIIVPANGTGPCLGRPDVD